MANILLTVDAVVFDGNEVSMLVLRTQSVGWRIAENGQTKPAAASLSVSGRDIWMMS